MPTTRSGGPSSAGSSGALGRPGARRAGATERTRARKPPATSGKARTARKGDLADRVRESIERKILQGGIGAGWKLNASALAEELGVSRAPVREALRSLEEAGLVRSVPNQGVYVREIELQEALHLYDIRIGLARQAGRLLAARVTKEQLQELERLHARMERSRAKIDPDAYHQLNLCFHSRLMEFTGNPWLWSMDEGIKKQLHLFLRRGIAGPGQLRRSSADHHAILDAIQTGDQDRAADAYERHSIGGKQRMLDTVGRTELPPGDDARRRSGRDGLPRSGRRW